MLEIRKIVIVSEATITEGGPSDDDGPLPEVAVLAAVPNPYTPAPWSHNLEQLIRPSREIAVLLAERGLVVLGGGEESYGKGAIVGLAGEPEHANACPTSVFSDAVREAIGGAKAWIPSTTKRSAAGGWLDIPVCYRHAISVRSRHGTISVSVPDAPGPDEIVVGLAVTNRGGVNARLGGLRKNDVISEDGLR